MQPVYARILLMISYIPPRTYITILRHGRERGTLGHVYKLRHKVDAMHDKEVQEMQKARVKAWKSKLQRDDREAYRWLKGGVGDQVAVMRMPDGNHNAHIGTQLRAVQEAWRPIYEKTQRQYLRQDSCRQHLRKKDPSCRAKSAPHYA